MYTVETIPHVLALYHTSQNKQAKIWSVATGDKTSVDVSDECAIPLFQKPTEIEFPECPQSDLNVVVKEYSKLFKLLLAILK